MKKSIAFSSILISIFFLTLCRPSITITTDYDKSVDFSKFKTFGFLPLDDPSKQFVNDIDRQRLNDAVADELIARGWQRVEGAGDAMIGFHVIVEKKTGTTAYTNYYGGMGYGYGFGYGYYGSPGMSSTTVQQYDYLVGTVIIDIFDSETKKLVWEGVGNGQIDENRKHREENIKKDVARMFADFPVAKVPQK